MTLRDVLLRIREFDGGAAIYVERPVTLSTAAIVHGNFEEEDPPDAAAGMAILIDGSHAREVLDGLYRLLRDQQGQPPTQDALLDRFLVYLKQDA